MSKDQLKSAILDAIRKINIEAAAHCAPVHTHNEILHFRGITELRRLGKLLRVKYYGKLAKQELIPGIADALHQPAMLRLFLNGLDKTEWTFFLKAIAKKEIQADHAFLDFYISAQHMGLLQSFYHQDQLYFVIPDEIKITFEKLKSTGYIEEKDFRDDLIEFAIAAINLYGVVSQADFAALYNSHSKRQTSIDEVFSILVGQVRADIGFCFWNEYIVDDEFEDDDFQYVEDLLLERQGKPRYSPPYEEFMRYADWDYYEFTPQLEALQRHLTKYIPDPEKVLDLLDLIHNYGEEEVRPKIYFDLLAASGVVFDGIEQINEMLQLIVDVHNNTRLWRNYGHTPNELAKICNPKILSFPAGHPAAGVKIGRNDTCPCGSGKKYKNCCGKSHI